MPHGSAGRIARLRSHFNAIRGTQQLVDADEHVQVAGGQQLGFPRLEPAPAGVALTLGAVPVSARVVRDGSMSAVRALIAMSIFISYREASHGDPAHFAVRPDNSESLIKLS